MPKPNKLFKQTIIELYKVHKWTPKQIANQFNISVRSVMAAVDKREPTKTCLYCGKELE